MLSKIETYLSYVLRCAIGAVAIGPASSVRLGIKLRKLDGYRILIDILPSKDKLAARIASKTYLPEAQTVESASRDELQAAIIRIISPVIADAEQIYVQLTGGHRNVVLEMEHMVGDSDSGALAPANPERTLGRERQIAKAHLHRLLLASPKGTVLPLPDEPRPQRKLADGPHVLVAALLNEIRTVTCVGKQQEQAH